MADKECKIDGVIHTVYCECDEEWDAEKHSANAIKRGEYNKKCDKCGMYYWIRRIGSEI